MAGLDNVNEGVVGVSGYINVISQSVANYINGLSWVEWFFIICFIICGLIYLIMRNYYNYYNDRFGNMPQKRRRW